jgi:EAL domain-containing protein (putative c-di-GMP-specific phosphodiesterase class I)
MVIEHACGMAQTWLDRAPALTLDLGISVNVTPRQLEDPELIPRLEEILEQSNVPPGMLRLELTEDALMNEVESLLDAIERLRDAGIEIGLDNFGTGFSSLQYMQQLRIATIKIDRTFLRAIDRASTHRAVIESALGIGRALGIDVIAAGVEALDQLTELRKLGMRYAQGYLLCEPLDAESATDLMLERAGV